jgi:hypothetical protein
VIMVAIELTGIAAGLTLLRAARRSLP